MLYFELENELKFYNLRTRSQVIETKKYFIFGLTCSLFGDGRCDMTGVLFLETELILPLMIFSRCRLNAAV